MGRPGYNWMSAGRAMGYIGSRSCHAQRRSSSLQSCRPIVPAVKRAAFTIGAACMWLWNGEALADGAGLGLSPKQLRRSRT
jgi:hypothetical protein